MAKIKEVLESNNVPAVRLLWKTRKGETKPSTYYTFQRVARVPEIHADDLVKKESETYLVRIVTKKDFEDLLDRTIESLRTAGFTVSSVDPETYETDTGYWIVPVTVKIKKERKA